MIKRGYGNAIHHLRRGSSRVVVLGITKSGVAGRNLIVEVSQTSRALQVPDVVTFRKKRRLPAHAPAQSPEEFPLINAIGGIVQRVC